MAAAKCPETTWHTASPRAQIPAALRSAEFVFVRHGARRAPLTRPYDGPFRVIERGEKFFKIKVGTREQVVTVDRLKPAFGFADPAPPSVTPEKIKITVLKTGTKKSLNPAAEAFVLSSEQPGELPPTVTRSRFGRACRPPERLGV